MTRTRKRYALVGTGSRADLFISALLDTHADVGELVALCDINPERMRYYKRNAEEKRGRTEPLPTYAAREFDRMVEETSPDTVIVTTVDRTHHLYIVRAMELGCDVITEKPMTTDAEKCQQILDTVERTGRDLRVTFNYRYSPRNSKVKEILQSGEIGEVISVHFEWLLDTMHGADYFRRWHRDKRNSGGLMVHKATHHFDLVNWWIGASPRTVFAMGDLRFYGRANAEARGVSQFPYRYHGSDTALSDPFAIQLEANPIQKRLYLDAEKEDGYIRDQNVFGDNISIEDTMAVMVRYDSKALLTYSLNAFSPWEGYRVMFNGTKGRLEVDVVERPYVSASQEDSNMQGQRDSGADTSLESNSGDAEPRRRPVILVQPHWEKAREVPVEGEEEGGHGGGDIRLLDDLFRVGQPDPLGRAANYLDGARSILIGIAANSCFGSEHPVDVTSLVRFPDNRSSVAAPTTNTLTCPAGGARPEDAGRPFASRASNA